MRASLNCFASSFITDLLIKVKQKMGGKKLNGPKNIHSSHSFCFRKKGFSYNNSI